MRIPELIGGLLQGFQGEAQECHRSLEQLLVSQALPKFTTALRIGSVKTNRSGSTLHISLEGAIGETTPMFTLPLDETKEINLDLEKMTYINSIGVRQWILWTMKIPNDCVVKLHNCPFVIASQASMVVGFLTKKMTLESIRLPYACENCNFEEMYFAVRGKDYEYPINGHPPRISIPEHRECPKCKAAQLEPDLIREKSFKFLG